jgi:RNase H-fold protein (predicted Holliday junction resolvase)
MSSFSNASEEDQIAMGNDAEKLLLDVTFNTVMNNLVESAFQAFVVSKPDNKDGRETIYNAYRAVTDIVATLQQRVQVRDQILAKRENSEEE